MTTTNANTMLTEQQVAQFKNNGFVLGWQVLSDDEVEVLRAEIDRVIANKDNPDVPQPVRIINLSRREETPVWQIVNIWQASEPFRALLSRREIVEAIAQLTGATELRTWHDQLLYKPATIGGTTRWHQDAPLWPILAPMTEVSAWVALDDADESNGCMSMVPGSYLWGDHMNFLRTLPNLDALPAEIDGHKVERVFRPVKKGAVHFHHALTWHSSHANTSGRPRRAIALHYMTQETRYVASGDHVMKPYVEVADGELMRGTSFPLVYERTSVSLLSMERTGRTTQEECT